MHIFNIYFIPQMQVLQLSLYTSLFCYDRKAIKLLQVSGNRFLHVCLLLSEITRCTRETIGAQKKENWNVNIVIWIAQLVKHSYSVEGHKFDPLSNIAYFLLLCTLRPFFFLNNNIANMNKNLSVSDVQASFNNQKLCIALMIDN